MHALFYFIDSYRSRSRSRYDRKRSSRRKSPDKHRARRDDSRSNYRSRPPSKSSTSTRTSDRRQERDKYRHDRNNKRGKYDTRNDKRTERKNSKVRLPKKEIKKEVIDKKISPKPTKTVEKVSEKSEKSSVAENGDIDKYKIEKCKIDPLLSKDETEVSDTQTSAEMKKKSEETVKKPEVIALAKIPLICAYNSATSDSEDSNLDMSSTKSESEVPIQKNIESCKDEDFHLPLPSDDAASPP